MSWQTDHTKKKEETVSTTKGQSSFGILRIGSRDILSMHDTKEEALEAKEEDQIVLEFDENSLPKEEVK